MPYVLKVCFNTNSINILVTQRSYQETSMLTHLVNIIFLLFLLSSVSVQATTLTVDGLANKNTPKATDVAFHLIDMKTGKTLIAQREDQLQPPASLQKLVTALAAKLYLKDDFRFVTRLERNKEDVIIRFSGDPNFSSDDLDGLFKTLRANQSVIKVIYILMVPLLMITNGPSGFHGITLVFVIAPLPAVFPLIKTVPWAIYMSNLAQAKHRYYCQPKSPSISIPHRYKSSKQTLVMMITVR